MPRDDRVDSAARQRGEAGRECEASPRIRIESTQRAAISFKLKYLQAIAKVIAPKSDSYSIFELIAQLIAPKSVDSYLG